MLSYKSKKLELLKFTVPEQVYTINHTIHRQEFFDEFEIFRNREMKSYKELDEQTKKTVTQTLNEMFKIARNNMFK